MGYWLLVIETFFSLRSPPKGEPEETFAVCQYLHLLDGDLIELDEML